MAEHPWILQRRTSAYLKDWLTSYGIPYKSTQVRRRYGNFCLEVKRFQIWTYWRPLTVQRFEQMTLHYEGPYCPIFASRLRYKNDDRVVYEGFDFNMSKNHHYESRPFYFVIPEFLLYRPLPAPRNWRWQPAVKVTASVVRDLLWLEMDYGGWPVNRRRRPLIPLKTGCAGVIETQEPGAGWASYTGRYVDQPKLIYKQGDLFNVN